MHLYRCLEPRAQDTQKREGGVRGKKFNKLTENSMKPGFF